MLTLTYFVHGTTTDNERGISSGWSDAELSELGIKQSVDLKQQIGDKKFDVVFCSDLKRAVKGKTWSRAFAEDWRKTKAWQPGWGYEVG